jgi:OHCU decarboxylase
MRSNPAAYDLVAAGTLSSVVSLLAKEPKVWLPIAGGTDLMVQYAAGKLAARKLVSIWNIPELRRIDVGASEIWIGAGCTYTDIRKHEIVGCEFPLLQRAAAWTGGIANQNRGTIGGNIVNASPAADSLPALLAYEAELILVSIRGERRLSYAGFHTGYKKTLLAPDELIQSICLPRRFAGYFNYACKVGARNSQAISKICIAGVGRLAAGVVEDIRIAVGSVAPVPMRLTKAEDAARGKVLDSNLLLVARKLAIAEIQPIDDIRSTARYRAVVAGNLVAEFLSQLGSEKVSEERNRGQAAISRWNRLSADEAYKAILPCCGSKAWARGMLGRRPIADEAELLTAADETWRALAVEDWMEAFRSHPRIGESSPPSLQLGSASSLAEQSVEWSAQEQSNVADAEAAMKQALADSNLEYERKFHRTFIVCATGKSVAEILEILRRRLMNDSETELQEAAEQQRQITQIRLKKWLQA